MFMLMGFVLEPCFANPEQEAKSLAERLQQQPLAPPQILDDLRPPSTDRAFEAQGAELEALFNAQFDSGQKGEDPLKSNLAKKHLEASQTKSVNQPSLSETGHLLKQKHRFKISHEDVLFKKEQEIANASRDNIEGPFQKGQVPQEPLPALKDKMVTCRQSAVPESHTCVKRLKVNVVPQAPLVKTVTAYFTARCYNLVTFNLNLKTGHIGVYQCENQGPKDVRITNPIGEPEIPSQTTIELLSAQHFGEGGVDFRTHQMNPSVANGFTASFTAFQPKTGKKHDGNKNNVRGGQYVWRVTLPRHPVLQETWEGCEDLERQAQEGFCEMVSLEPQYLNETRSFAGYPHPITRPHWLENNTYLCGEGRGIDECETLLQQKCTQVNSQCVAFKNERCIEFENTFKCAVPDYLKGDGLSFQNGRLSFLKENGSAALGYEPHDFGVAAAHFNALTEMGKKLQDELGGILGNPSNPNVFQGKCSQCRVNMGSFFRDCCKLKGLLRGLLGQCSEEEKKLAIAALRNKRCVKIEGRYCHKKKLGVCVEKRDSYCCYGSQLARIIQEIAHQQLNIPWGDAENPNCGPLSASELSRINFDTPDAQAKLSEILAEVQATAQEKFERVQQAVGSINVEEKAQSLEKKQQMEFEKFKKGVR